MAWLASSGLLKERAAFCVCFSFVLYGNPLHLQRGVPATTRRRLRRRTKASEAMSGAVVRILRILLVIVLAWPEVNGGTLVASVVQLNEWAAHRFQQPSNGNW